MVIIWAPHPPPPKARTACRALLAAGQGPRHGDQGAGEGFEFRT